MADEHSPDLRLDDAFTQDPHALNARLRAEGPVHEVILPFGTRVWLVTRYDEARAVLSDPSLSKAGRRQAEFLGRPGEQPRDSALMEHLINSDPPQHTRLRRLVNKAFTVRRIEALRPRIEELTAELLDSLDDSSGPVDLLSSFALPLPMTVICELLGVPIDDRDNFRTWSEAILSDKGDQAGASKAMAGYLLQLIGAKSATGSGAADSPPEPSDDSSDDLLSALLRVRDEDGDRLSEPELLSMVFLLLVAGHETTVNLIGNGILALLADPAQLDTLRADPSLIPGAVEEFLRYEGPVALSTMRFTTTPLRVGDVEIPEGAFVLVSLLGTNRDPALCSEPDRLDVTRKPVPHLAFGHGIHYCLGAPLARLEGEIAFRGLLSRFPRLRLAVPAADLRWRGATMVRGLESLPVLLSRE
ncbi:cytochrome P450 family protein [Flindersiella endophytica]